MTPSTTLNWYGFVQGLQANMMGLVGSLILIFVIFLIVRWFISNSMGDNQSDASSARSWTNGIAGVLALLVIAIFCVNAVTYATNAIPRSALDRSSINQDMNANTQP